MNISTTGSSAFSAADLAAMRKERFQKADTDSSGTINRAELTEAISNAPKPPGAPEIDTDKLFQQLDEDGDGELTEAEMEEGMEALKPSGAEGNRPPPPAGPPPGDSGSVSAEDDANTVYDKRDTNEDGTVSFEEQMVYDLTHPKNTDEANRSPSTEGANASEATSAKAKVGVYIDTQA